MKLTPSLIPVIRYHREEAVQASRLAFKTLPQLRRDDRSQTVGYPSQFGLAAVSRRLHHIDHSNHLRSQTSLEMMYPNTRNQDYPDSAYPLVSTARDREAARQAYLSTTALLDYVADNHGDEPFLCPIDLDSISHTVYSFKEVRQLVKRFAKRHAEVVGSRKSKDEPAKVVGLMASAGMEYWLHDRALQRL